MSLISKRELTLVVSPRYRSASRADKGRILDEFVATRRKFINAPLVKYYTRHRIPFTRSRPC